MIEQPFREMSFEDERNEILAMVGPDRWVLVVCKELRDAVLAKYGFAPEDVPGLMEPIPIAVHPALRMLDEHDRRHRPAIPGTKPLPYPPATKGRYAR